MIYEFLITHRIELIERCRSRVAQRIAPRPTEKELAHGIPLFLDQLIKTLAVEVTPGSDKGATRISGVKDGGNTVLSEIGTTAALHGRELFLHGYTIDQVVRDYGDLCQEITALASQRGAPFAIEEFRTLNRCLDNAIAGAVTEYSYQRDFLIAEKQIRALNERVGFFAHELRNHLNTATLAVSVIKSGNVGLSGATGAVLDRSLAGMRLLIERSLTEVRMTADMVAQRQPFSLSDFIAEVELAAALEAQTHGCVLTVALVDPNLAVDADRDLLFSAVGNLLQNAFKFTSTRTEVTMNAYAAADRILIEVSDHCGGLPAGDTEHMFRPFAQGGANRTGLGLGLPISRSSVEANHGTLSVRDVPGTGCVFTIDLPRYSLSHTSGNGH
jgi:signal transduction histidine kinase